MAERVADRRAELLDAAVRVFAEKGFHATRVGDIATEAGVAHGLLYHYFRSKDDVLDTVFRDTWSALVAETRRIESSDYPLREQLRLFARIYLGAWLQTPDLVRVLVREVARGPAVRSRVAEIGDRGLGPVRRTRGDPHGLGSRPAAGRRGRGRARGDDRRQRRPRRSGSMKA
jgi:AcrR family transcriptional regulator